MIQDRQLGFTIKVQSNLGGGGGLDDARSSVRIHYKGTVKPRLSEQLCSQNSVLCSDK